MSKSRKTDKHQSEDDFDSLSFRTKHENKNDPKLPIEEEKIEKELPCFEPSGILAEFSNKT